MRTAQDIMTRNIVSVTEDTSIAETAHLLLEHSFNGLPVMNKDGLLTGIICQSDIVAQQKILRLPTYFTLLDGLISLTPQTETDEQVKRMTASTVKDAMSTPPTTVTPETNLDKVASLMVDANYHTVPVVRENHLVGIIGMADLLKTIAEDHA